MLHQFILMIIVIYLGDCVAKTFFTITSIRHPSISTTDKHICCALL